MGRCGLEGRVLTVHRSILGNAKQLRKPSSLCHRHKRLQQQKNIFTALIFLHFCAINIMCIVIPENPYFACQYKNFVWFRVQKFVPIQGMHCANGTILAFVHKLWIPSSHCAILEWRKCMNCIKHTHTTSTTHYFDNGHHTSITTFWETATTQVHVS